MSEKMHNDNETQSPKSVDRRRFMELTAKFGFTAAAIAMTTGIVGSREAHAAKVSNEEKLRLCQTGSGRPARCGKCPGSESSEWNDPGSTAFHLQFCTLCSSGRPDQYPVLVRRKPEVCKPCDFPGLEK